MNIDSRVSGNTKVMAVIGNPISHSVSPQLHNTISSYLGVNAVYVPFKVEKEGLENAVRGLKALGVVGFNVTIPFKKDIMRYLDENTKEALLMGAVNTVKNNNGRLYGYNTDAEGFARSFKEASGEGFKGKRVTIVGAGGVARAIGVKVAMEEAREINIINRTVSKAEDIVEIINNNYGNIAKWFSTEDRRARQAFAESEIIVNSTSVGMHPDEDMCPVDDSYRFSQGQIVFDAVYNPPKTKLLAKAEESGCRVVNGMGMLFYQGINAYEIWTGIKMDDSTVKSAYKSFLNILGK